MVVVYIFYVFIEVVVIYLIIFFFIMVEFVDEWLLKNKKNLFNEFVKVVEM